MNTPSLPLFIQEPYRILYKDIEKTEEVQLIQRLFLRTMSFLGNLVVLEYLQAKNKSPALNYQILCFRPQAPHQWLFFLRQIITHFDVQQMDAVLFPIFAMKEKYPSLRSNSENDDRITKLIWFYNLFTYSKQIVCKEDIQDSKEQLTNFLESLDFLDKLNYKRNRNRTGIIFLGKTLWVTPFYKLYSDENGKTLDIDIEGVKAWEQACELWIPDDFFSYRQQVQGHIDQQNILQEHRHSFILAPWLQTKLEDCIDKIFFAACEIATSNVLLIEGYPGTGKTALAANLASLFKDGYCVLTYFIIPDTCTQNYLTYAAWLRKQLQTILHYSDEDNSWEAISSQLQLFLMENSKKIIIAIDGIEYMPLREYQNLQNLFAKFLPTNTIFVLLKRLFEFPEIETTHRICLSHKDNMYFQEFFTADYLQSLKQRYITFSSSAKKIFSFLSQNNTRFFSAVEIAQYLGVFTPEILQAIKQIKPLCEVATDLTDKEINGEKFPVERYRLFNCIRERSLHFRSE